MKRKWVNKGKEISSILLAVVLAVGNSMGAQAATSAGELSIVEDAAAFIQEFEDPTAQSGSSIRYWLMNANITAEQIKQDLKSIADAGFGSIEVTWVQNYDSENYNTNEYGWGSEKWMETLEHVLEAGKEYGLEVDILYCNRWPAGVPFDNDDYASMTNEDITQALDQDYSAKQLSYSSLVLSEGDFTDNGDGTYSFSGNVPVAAALSYGESKVKFTLHPVAFTVAKTKLSEEGSVDMTDMWGETTTKAVVNTSLDKTSLADVTSEKGTDAQWTVNEDTMKEIREGKWTMFGFYWQVTGQANKKESNIYTGVIDHYSVQGSNALINYWDSMLSDYGRELLAEVGGDFFEDSLEMGANVEEDSTNFTTGTFIPWTADTELGTDSLSSFEEKTGYQLAPYLPLLIGSYGSAVQTNEEGKEVYYNFEDQSGERVAEEYKRVMSSLMMENHMDVMTEWAEKLGVNFRVQAYITTNEEGGIDFIDAASRVGTIEGETLAFDESNAAGGYDSFRYLSGGAHIAGKQIVSDETGARFAEYIYAETAQDLVDIVNRNVASGVNQFVLHGYPENYEFVGTTDYKWPGWGPFDEGTGGGVYEAWGEDNPVWENFEVIGDYLSRTQTVMQTGIAKKDLVFYYDELTVKQTTFNTEEGNVLSQNGYDYEFLSPRVLDEEIAYVEDGILAPESAAYQAMLFYNQKDLSLDTLEILNNYSDDGLPLIFIGDIPSKVTSYSNYEEDCLTLQEGLEELLEKDNVYQIASEDGLISLLREIGITPSAQYESDSQLITLHRQDKGADFYWMYNRGGDTENMDIAFEGSGVPYELNLWTGEIIPITDYEVGDGTTQIPCTVEAGDTCVIMIMEDELAEIETAETELNVSTAESLSLKDSEWTLAVESWTEDTSDPAGLSTLKTELPVIVLEGLTNWSDIKGLEIVSGNATYTTNFDYKNEISGIEKICISTAEGTVAVTDVLVNGNAVSMNQKTGKADIGRYLINGENEISISIATGLSTARLQTQTREYGLLDVTIDV